MLASTKETSCKRAERRHLLGALILVAVTSHGAAAAAQQGADAQDTAAAEALFADARRLVTAGRIVEACPKFAESQRLAPAAGTLLNLGICYEKSGRTASAWATFKEAELFARTTSQSERAQIARSHVAALEPKLSTVTLHVDDEVRKTPGVEVRRDGDLLASAAWSSAMPVDPGKHRIEVRAPSMIAWSETIDVGPDGDAKIVAVPALKAEPRLAGATARPAEGALAATSPAATPSSTQRTLGYLVGGVGLAALGASGVFGFLAKSNNDDALANHCNTSGHCDDTGLSLTKTAQTDALVSTITLAAGGVAVVSGIVLVLTSPKVHERRAALRAAPFTDGRTGGVIVGGTW